MYRNLITPMTTALENIVGKGENVDTQHFSPFPTMLSKLQTKLYQTIKLIITAFNLNPESIVLCAIR